MAIYKPSNCAPFMESWDLTQPQTITCEINTNNIPVTGYKLKILDSKNNVIFEGSEFSPLPNNQMGLNESTLTIPFILVAGTTAKNANQLVVGEFGKGTTICPHFYNNYPYQPFKWQITLAQKQLKNGAFIQTPIDENAYDMTVVSGTIIGSTKNRIQGKLSEEIFADYFIQLYQNDKETTVGERVLIKSYDHTYGYLYPQEGKFTEENISQAEYFKIFKNTNNIEYINTNRIVDNITAQPMNSWRPTGSSGPTTSWGAESFDVSKYYMTQTYTNVRRPTGATGSTVDYPIPISAHCSAGSGDFTSGSTLLLVKDEGSQAEGSEMRTSPYNGVFLFVSAQWKRNDDQVDFGTLTVVWQRPAMADTWAEFLGQSFYVKEVAQNWDSNATSSGTINSTPLGFMPEKAIEIYPNDEDKTFGKVFKTNEVIEKDGKIYKKIYINPFTGLENGMRFEYLHGAESGYFNDIEVDTADWHIGVTGDSIPDFTPDEDTYKITSFFKTSDENPFYTYGAPELFITEINEEKTQIEAGGVEVPIYETAEAFVLTNRRKITAYGTYNSNTKNVSWISYKWTLEDLLYSTIKEEETKYSGEIKCDFVGLENEHIYVLRLVVEDSLGRVISTSKTVIMNVNLQNTLPLDIFFDCNNAAVGLSFVMQGRVEPTPGEGVGTSYSSDGVKLSLGHEEITGNGLMEYSTTQFGDITGVGDLSGNLYGPTENTYTLISEHKDLSPYFEGSLIRTVHDVGEYRYKDTRVVCELGFYPDVVIWKGNLTQANPERNKLYTKMAVVQKMEDGEWDESDELITLKSGDYGFTFEGGPTNDTWRELNLPVYAMNKDGKVKVGYDYVDCDVVYDATGSILPEHKQIKGVGSWNSTADPKQFGMGFCLKQVQTMNFVTGSTTGIWLDKKLKQIEQADGSKICVEYIEDEWNYWPSAEEEANWYWHDKDDYELYKQQDVNADTNHSGRQEIAGKTLQSSIQFINFDPTILNVDDRREIKAVVKMTDTPQPTADLVEISNDVIYDSKEEKKNE